jgi:hypothetical protein
MNFPKSRQRMAVLKTVNKFLTSPELDDKGLLDKVLLKQSTNVSTMYDAPMVSNPSEIGSANCWSGYLSSNRSTRLVACPRPS